MEEKLPWNECRRILKNSTRLLKGSLKSGEFRIAIMKIPLRIPPKSMIDNCYNEPQQINMKLQQIVEGFLRI